jgi:hypothetical protein
MPMLPAAHMQATAYVIAEKVRYIHSLALLYATNTL